MSNYGYTRYVLKKRYFSILGENISVREGHTRVFVYNTNNDTKLRSNNSYDEAIKLLEVRIIHIF